MINKIIILVIVILFSFNNVFANSGNENSFMDSAKFFVVVGVLTTILAGIFFLLLYLERKISKLENHNNQK
jgi:uncharacterized integral membrane protein